MDHINMRHLLDSVFEETALLLGGMIPIHQIRNETIWDLVRGLERLRRHAFGKIERAEDEPFRQDRELGLEPHPAIERFLETIRDEKGY